MVEASPYGPPAIDVLKRPSVDTEPIAPEKVGEELDLMNSQRTLLNSINAGIWGKIRGGRMLLEVRNTSVLNTSGGGAVNIYDFDDCLMSATGWHNEEFARLERDQRLHDQGIIITAEQAKQVYELSKITVPDFAEKEKRYTPQLNLILLSRFAEARKAAGRDEKALERAFDELMGWREMINGQVQAYGERALRAYTVNPWIQRVLTENPPAEFLHSDFVDNMFGLTGKKDMRVIASRGKIEGPLGQVYKVHSSGLMKPREHGKGIDMAIYTNDLKAEALLYMINLVPDIGQRHIRIFDDNPNEIIPYLDVASDLGARNIEVVHVVHPDAKRKDIKVEASPTMVYTRGNVVLRHYSLLSKEVPLGAM